MYNAKFEKNMLHNLSCTAPCTHRKRHTDCFKYKREPIY